MATSIGGYLIKCLIVSCLTEQSTCDIVLCALIQVTSIVQVCRGTRVNSRSRKLGQAAEVLDCTSYFTWWPQTLLERQC